MWIVWIGSSSIRNVRTPVPVHSVRITAEHFSILHTGCWNKLTKLLSRCSSKLKNVIIIPACRMTLLEPSFESLRSPRVVALRRFGLALLLDFFEKIIRVHARTDESLIMIDMFFKNSALHLNTQIKRSINQYSVSCGVRGYGSTVETVNPLVE